MNNFTLFKVLAHLLALALAAASWSLFSHQAKAQSPSPEFDAKSPAATTTNSTPETATVDSENARKLREKIRAQFAAQDPNDLADAARTTGNEARAKFVYGRAIAVWRAREVRLTDQRLALRKQAEQFSEERAKEREKLDREMQQIRDQFRGDQATCDAQLTALIASYRPRLTQLKTDAALAESLAAKSDAKLDEIRREILSLEQQSRIVAQGKSAKSATPRIVDLELDFPADSFKSAQLPKASGPANPAATTASVDQLLKELE